MGVVRKEGASKRQKAIAVIGRILAFMVLVLAMQITFTQGYGTLSDRLEKLTYSIEALSSPTESIDLLDAVAETTGADFLKGMEKNALQAP